MSDLRERVEAAITYLEADAAGDVKGKWAKGYRAACADSVAILRLVLATEEPE